MRLAPHPPAHLRETPSQTAGPYVHLGLVPAAAGLDRGPAGLAGPIAVAGVTGERIRIEGRVLDGTGAPLRDAVIECWQADAAGIYHHPDDPRHAQVARGFRGWGRVATDADSGLWGFETIRPGPVPLRDGRVMAPHVALWIVARGINTALATRMYFADADNAADPLLARIDPPARRATLLAARESGEGMPHYRFDIRLQGPEETVFLDI